MSRLTQQQIESIPELYINGMSIKKIAKELNCTHPTILKYLKKAEVEMRPSHFHSR